MEGWNDCPPVMLQTNSTTSSRTGKRRVKRVGHDFSSANSSQVSLTQLPVYISLKGSTSMTDLPHSTSLNPSTPQETPVPKPGSVVYQNDISDSWVQIPHPQAPFDLNSLFQLPTKLSNKELSHYKKRIEASLPNLSANDVDFLNSILARTGLISNQSAPGIQDDILAYTVANTGVSGWCIPLKKIIENAKI